jgi:hypothetical protein
MSAVSRIVRSYVGKTPFGVDQIGSLIAFRFSSDLPPIPAAVAHQSLSRSSASEHERLMVRVWLLDLNIESHETIKQWCFSI